MKNVVIIMVLSAFCFSFTGCATVSPGGERGLSKAELKRLEKEKDYALISGISTFSGFVIGGLTGILTAVDSEKIASLIKGCLIGGAVGFGAGYVIIENLKNSEPKPNSKVIDEYFKEYQMIKGKESK